MNVNQILQLLPQDESETCAQIRQLASQDLPLEDKLKTIANIAEHACMLDVAIASLELWLTDNGDDIPALEQLYELLQDLGDDKKSMHILHQLANLATPYYANLYLDKLIEGNKLSEAEDFISKKTSASLACSSLTKRLQSYQETHKSQTGPTECPHSYTQQDAIMFLELFRGRIGVYARQWQGYDGKTGYSPVYQTLTPELIKKHLNGDLTLGVYCLQKDSTASFLAFDVDIRAELQHALQSEHSLKPYLEEAWNLCSQIALSLKSFGLECIQEFSGYKGYHLWVLFEEPTPAHHIRSFAHAVLNSIDLNAYAHVKVDIFPAQSSIKGKKLGNLIKLPLGLHLKTAKWSQFIDASGTLASHPFLMLNNYKRIKPDAFVALAQEKGNMEPYWAAAEEHDEAYSDSSAPAKRISEEPPYDLNLDKELQYLLQKCPVLEYLIKNCIHEQSISYEQYIILRHTVGHLSQGNLTINQLLHICDAGLEMDKMNSPLRGNPMSCKKIRTKLADKGAVKQCVCIFERNIASYQHPLLHMHTFQSELHTQNNVKSDNEQADIERINKQIDDLKQVRGHILARINQRKESQQEQTSGEEVANGNVVLFPKSNVPK